MNRTTCLLYCILLLGLVPPVFASDDHKDQSSPGCDTDTVSPVVHWKDSSVFSTGPFSCEAAIFASAIDAGSSDECSSKLDFRINLTGISAASPLEQPTHIFLGLGEYNVTMWVIDESGNWSNCTTAITVVDRIDPVAQCADPVIISLNDSGEFILYAKDMNDGSWDNCTNIALSIELNPPSLSPPESTSITLTKPGSDRVILWVVDEAGNSNPCWNDLVVLEPGQHCNDSIAPTIICVDSLKFSLSGFENTVQIWAPDIPMDVSDDCSHFFNYGIELSNTGSSPPLAQSLIFDMPGTYEVTVWAGDDAGNWDFCNSLIMIEANTNPVRRVSGMVFQDTNNSCVYDVGESHLEGQKIQMVPYLNGIKYASNAISTLTLTGGLYFMDFNESFLNGGDSFDLVLIYSENMDPSCSSNLTLYPSDFIGKTEITHNFPVMTEMTTATHSPKTSQETLLRTYPNPFAHYANFELPPTVGGSLKLFDNSGREVINQSFTGERFVVSANQLMCSGMYFFKIATIEGQNYRGKLILNL